MRTIVGERCLYPWSPAGRYPRVRGWGSVGSVRMDRMNRCAHPGCGGPVVTTLTYDYAGRTVWLLDPGAQVAVGMGLCAPHADGFRPPVGWVLDDRRLPTIPFQSQVAV